jgi:hypothetical protein
VVEHSVSLLLGNDAISDGLLKLFSAGNLQSGLNFSHIETQLFN